MQELLEKYVKPHLLPIILALGGVVFFAYGFMGLGNPKDKPQDKKDILFEAASDSAKQNSLVQTETEIAVDIEGAVMKPGVYKLKADSRVQDALIAAGGMSEEADRDKVAKAFNLAAKISDGAKLYIPAEGEEAAVAGVSTSNSSNDAAASTVNINNASQSQLEALAGIGKVTAEKIISNRPYGSIEELVAKKVVGKSTFEKIKDKISVF